MAGWLGEHDDAHGGEEREHDHLAHAPRLALRVRRQVHDFCRDSRENEVKFFVLFCFVFRFRIAEATSYGTPAARGRRRQSTIALQQEIEGSGDGEKREKSTAQELT